LKLVLETLGLSSATIILIPISNLSDRKLVQPLLDFKASTDCLDYVSGNRGQHTAGDGTNT